LILLFDSNQNTSKDQRLLILFYNILYRYFLAIVLQHLLLVLCELRFSLVHFFKCLIDTFRAYERGVQQVLCSGAQQLWRGPRLKEI